MKTTRPHLTALSMACLLLSIVCLSPDPVHGSDPVAEAFDAYLESSSDGQAAFSFDRSDYQDTDTDDRAGLPIGVFDSGIGGLTVLEALFTADSFDNENLKPGPDGRPDFEHERFLYLGDQANMPYGNYSKENKTDYLRELILKDATFLLGNRYRDSAESEPRFDKPPVKAIVIACNTATAYGLDDLRAAVERWKIPVIVIGVVEAGARGLLQRQESDTDGQAIGVLATVGTCSSGVYPKTIQSTLGKAGRRITTITQQGSADLAAIIEGDPAVKSSLGEQIAADVRALVETHRDSRSGKSPEPIGTIVLGCTHFPLVVNEIESAFVELRRDPAFEPFLTESREYVDPAAWTARQLFQELARENLRASAKTPMVTKRDGFYISVPNANLDATVLAPDGSLEHSYKYGRHPGDFSTEDTVVVAMSRAALPASSRRLVREKLPETWSRLAVGEPEDFGSVPAGLAKP